MKTCKLMHDWWTIDGALGFGFWLAVHVAPLASSSLRRSLRIYDSNQSREPSPRTAREILDERFSKGEIDREGYEMRRKAPSGPDLCSKCKNDALLELGDLPERG